MMQKPGTLMALPRQDLDNHGAFSLEPGAVRQWLAQLPRANIGLTTRSLYEAIIERNRVRMSAVRRLDLMAALQPAIDLVRQNLRRHYLDQPILLPEQPRRVAELVRAINQATATGSSLAAVQAEPANPRGGGNPNRVIATALVGALDEHLQSLLLHCQLYQPAAPGLWQSIHALYQLACQRGVDAVGAMDDTDTPGSAYLRCLLLAGANPNQLRQRDLDSLTRRLRDWPGRVDLIPGAPEACILAANPASDEGPVYRIKAGEIGLRWLGLDLRGLVADLQRTLDEPTPDTERELLMHLIHAWSQTRNRSSMRVASNDRLQLSLGLSATHHFVSGEEDFQLFIHGDQAPPLAVERSNPFIKGAPRTPARGKDIWDRPYQDNYGQIRVSVETIDYNIRQHQKAQPRDTERFRSHPVQALDASPRGYCLQWPADNPATLRSGELIGLRLESDTAQWMIARIRWVQLLPAGPRLGVELLSPGAVPFAARVLQHGEAQGEYQRVLVLPEIKALRQPTTLITPRLPFREQHKVLLVQYGEQTRVQLTRQIASAGAFSQFEFRRLPDPRGAPDTGSENNGGFDSLWDKL